ncbi:AAA domain-containing protein [Sphingobacterium thalpophilum]|uniref:AAA domain-containing protein n=1 Tax=Sphingobacterium thalpophilum TaxID=259 RepID=UPI002D77CA3C|nr:AAA domain-containing protein [Sphingobacterium thalpophilum]
MSSKIFLQSLQSKLKGGNARSIHLNALPGRLATRLDLKQLDLIEDGLANSFLDTLLTKANFEFKISFDNIDLNEKDADTQKKLIIISKRLNSTIIENEDYFKEHGMKTLGFGYPILIKRSSKDPSKIIKAPLFIWQLEAVKSKNKVNEWSFLRNKVIQANGKIVESDIHPVSINEVLLSFIKSEDDITLPNLTNEALDDALIDRNELLNACAEVLESLNSNGKDQILEVVSKNFESPVNVLPEASQIDIIANNKAYIHFGGVFGLFRAQKESIITDITRLLDRFDDFEFDDLKVENLSTTPFSAVDTDPSQQAIISTLGKEANQIIQGPPGTGKSQSLTALITNALANGLKCLVVCEKKTALDVIKANIERTNPQIGALVGVIDDVNDAREAIVDSVRDRQTGVPFHISVRQAQNQYDTIKSKLRESAALINAQHTVLAQPVYGDKIWSQIVGRYLALRKKYNEVPLKNIISKQDFNFAQDHTELEKTCVVLKHAHNLFKQSHQVLDIFKPLADGLFLDQQVGILRIKIEDFIAYANQQIPSIEQLITGLQVSGKQWIDDFLRGIPQLIQQDFQPYLIFCIGDSVKGEVLPSTFSQEQRINEIVSELQTILVKAQQFLKQYEDALQQHYNDYHASLNNAITTYLTYAESSIAQYGTSLLNNSSGAKFKTSLLSIFSGKHKQIAQTRIELRSRISAVRSAHVQKNYIEHLYNDHLETNDLSIYLSNIEELRQQVAAWKEQYPHTISNYLSNINDHHFHPELHELKSKISPLLQKLDRLEQILIADYNIVPTTPVTDINGVIEAVPYLTERVTFQLRYFNNFRNYYAGRSDAYQSLQNSFDDIESNQITGNITNGVFLPYTSLKTALDLCNKLRHTIKMFNEHISDFRIYHEWKSFFLSLDETQQRLITTISLHLKDNWADAFECWYLYWILTTNEPQELPKSDYQLQQYQQQKQEFNHAQLNSIIALWTEKQSEAVGHFRSRGQNINSLFNKKGAKGMRRNSLRTIINREFQLFTDFFPVLLVNPSVCSSILPLQEGIFDLVIFDEASQLRLEDTYAALIRGKAKIVSGDKHQMPPSSYFEGSGALLDPIDDETEDLEDEFSDRTALQAAQLSLADSESLLAYAVDKGFVESYLKVHYRSKHPYLIDFSNHAFYGNRLMPVPAKEDYIPIEYLQIDGLYEGQVNKQEALKVVELLQQIMKEANDPIPSVGVATFNIYQRNLILETLSEVRQNDPVFDSLMAQAGDSFFVKNLENIQGDERDIIILSTTFGRKADGSFSQNFGPIIQGKGHRMLNVIITRARSKVYVCTSFPQEYVGQYPQLIHQKGNKGRGIMYAYLAYAKAVSEGNEELRTGILQLLSQYCTDKLYEPAEFSLGSESPFEDEVFERLAQHIDADRLEQQHSIGGFRIDIVVKPRTSGKPLIAIECDGSKYHNSPEAYAWDCFRQEQLESYGFVFHRIWSLKWWDDADSELIRLLDFVRQQHGEERNLSDRVHLVTRIDISEN